MAPKPPRVLRGYDPEFGYIVLGTHDADKARRLLRDYFDGTDQISWNGIGADEMVTHLPPPRLTWIRQTFGYGDYHWQVQRTAPNSRGASKAVEFRA